MVLHLRSGVLRAPLPLFAQADPVLPTRAAHGYPGLLWEVDSAYSRQLSPLVGRVDTIFQSIPVRHAYYTCGMRDCENSPLESGMANPPLDPP
eukprot:4738219-Pyramimonas_sp.AAC.1